MDAQQKQQIADKLAQSNNILVTVSTNPTVDQLAACLGLTLALNKMGKHAAAVFSGEVPSTLEFLQPENTIEKTTDSLRDFIISLDKAKADKLRYKVEDKVVKIFITPYRTSISDKDLEFSQGDFNVDIVIALGVHAQTDIDQAITTNGRILHDAVISTLNVKPGGEQLGTLNWLEPASSSLSEMVVQLLDAMKQKVMDGQMATAFLTGIVAETERFGNVKTSAQTMTISAELMSAGANPQLVATKLEVPKEEPAPVKKPVETPPAQPTPELAAPDEPRPIGPLAEASATPPTTKPGEGTLEIEHVDLGSATDSTPTTAGTGESLTPQIDIDREGTLRRLEELQAKAATPIQAPSETSGRKILQPLGAQQTSGSLDSSMGAADGLSLPQPNQEDFERPSGAPPLPPSGSLSSTFTPPANPFGGGALPQPASPSGAPAVTLPDPLTAPASLPSADTTLPAGEHLSNARDAVQAAHLAQSAPPLEPITALNALPLHLPLRDDQAIPGAPTLPDSGLGGSAPSLPPLQPDDGTTAPPPVPPPMMPPSPQ